MIEYLESIDIKLFTFLNGHYNAYFDQFMWLVSSRLAWIPMCLALLYVVFRNNWRNGLAALLLIALTITLSDQISSSIIKHAVERLRPTHTEALIPIVHTVNGYMSGLYGFVSSHAANSFGVAMILSLLFKNRWFTMLMFLWATILSYSRIYLGVHFPGDIIGGMIVGLAVASLLFFLYKKLLSTKARLYCTIDCPTPSQIKIMNYSILVNMCGLAAFAAILCFTT